MSDLETLLTEKKKRMLRVEIDYSKDQLLSLLASLETNTSFDSVELQTNARNTVKSLLVALEEINKVS